MGRSCPRAQRAPGAERDLGDLRRELGAGVFERLEGVGRAQDARQEAVARGGGARVELRAQLVRELARRAARTQHGQCRLAQRLARDRLAAQDRGDQRITFVGGRGLEHFEQALPPHGGLGDREHGPAERLERFAGVA